MKDVESDSEDDDADELPSMLPVSPAPFVPSSVQASVPSIPSMPSRVNSPQHIVVENHSMEDSAAASLARGNSKLSNSGTFSLPTELTNKVIISTPASLL